MSVNNASTLNTGTDLNQVNFGKRIEAYGAKDVQNADYILMLEVPQKLDLAQGAQTEHTVVEWGDLFDGDALLRGEVNGGTTRRIRMFSAGTPFILGNDRLTKRRHRHPRLVRAGLDQRDRPGGPLGELGDIPMTSVTW